MRDNLILVIVSNLDVEQYEKNLKNGQELENSLKNNNISKGKFCEIVFIYLVFKIVKNSNIENKVKNGKFEGSLIKSTTEISILNIY